MTLLINTKMNIIETLKMKPVDVKRNIYIGFNKESSTEGLKFKVDDNVTIWKYKNISAKDYTWNWSEEVSVVKKVKNAVPWIYAISDRSREETVGTFYKI